MRNSLTLAAAFSAWVGMAHADAFTDSVVGNLRELGYDFIEIQEGINQIKVEAIRGTDKLEVIYDRASGRILKQERERAEADEIGRTGLQIRNRNRDFLDVGSFVPTDSAFNRELVSRLQAEGYEFIEIKNGPTQIKVEAVRGSEKLEMIFDRETGEILKREIGRADAEYAGRSGVEIDTRKDDFLDDDEDDEDDDRSGRRGGRDDEDDDDDEHDDEDNSGHGSSDDEEDDEDDDDDDDEHDDEDNSGSGSSGSDDDDEEDDED